MKLTILLMTKEKEYRSNNVRWQLSLSPTSCQGLPEAGHSILQAGS